MAKNEPTVPEPESNYSEQRDKGSTGAHNRGPEAKRVIAIRREEKISSNSACSDDSREVIRRLNGGKAMFLSGP